MFSLVVFIFKYGMEVFLREQPGEKNGREISLCSKFKLNRNSNSVTETNKNCSGVSDFLIRQEIYFFHRPADHKMFTGGRFYQESFPLRNSKTRHKTKHSKMREKHLIKTVTHPWRVSTKIKKQSKHVPNKLPRKKEGLHFWLYHAKLTLVYLHSLLLSVPKFQMF